MARQQQFEDRVTVGGPGTRLGGRARPAPGPQYAGETRGPQLPVHSTRTAGSTPHEAGYEPPSVVHLAGTMSRLAAAAAGRLAGAQQAGETRGAQLPPLPAARASSPHATMTGTHIHQHSDYQGGVHVHEHTHRGDGEHNHPHAAGEPGNPDAGMPSAGLASAVAGGETRDVSGISLAEQISRFLAAQGVDVRQAVRDAGYAREHAARRAREAAGRAQDLALNLRAAKRALAFEQRGFVEHAPGFGIAKVGEAQQRVDQLTAALAETLGNDRELIGEANRRAAR